MSPSAAFKRRFDEAAEQRVRFRGLGLKFGMELAREKEWMIAMLDGLHQFAVGRRAADDESLSLHSLAVLVVELVPVTMPLADRVLAVESGIVTGTSSTTS